MAEISDILKIGKDKYLEKNLEQKCGNPFNEWIPYDIISFRCYVENGIKKYEIYGEDIYSRIERIKIRPWRYLISQEDGEFAIKYGIESYFGYLTILNIKDLTVEYIMIQIMIVLIMMIELKNAIMI